MGSSLRHPHSPTRNPEGLAMKENGLFTIGIPTYNRASVLLKRAIDSALTQSAENVEILVVDNASTDETQKVVAEAGKRVRYVRNETNLGMTRNFLRVIEEA